MAARGWLPSPMRGIYFGGIFFTEIKDFLIISLKI